jgi:tryptophan synthase alpha subunit
MANSKPVGIAFEDPVLDGATIGKSNGTAGFFGTDPVPKAAALTAGLTHLTAKLPVAYDYVIADLTQTTPFGFVSANEGQTVLTVIANLQTRVTELESRLRTYGLLA